MITFIAFVLTIAGCVNWLLIGLLQYDFIAGLFGFQASIFSRIVYIIFGVASAYLIIRVIANKGTFKVWEKKKKKSQEAPAQAMQPVNVEAGQEQTPAQHIPQEKPKKCKKWWQFWKKNEKTNKNRDNLNAQTQQPAIAKTAQPQPAQPFVEVNIPAQRTPFPTDAPSQGAQYPTSQNAQTTSQDNLFDEHLNQ